MYTNCKVCTAVISKKENKKNRDGLQFVLEKGIYSTAKEERRQVQIEYCGHVSEFC